VFAVNINVFGYNPIAKFLNSFHLATVKFLLGFIFNAILCFWNNIEMVWGTKGFGAF